MNKNILTTFSKKWRLKEETVETIYTIIGQQGRQYGRVSRFLRGLNIQLSARQLKYFFHRARLAERIDENEKGKPANYAQLLRNEKVHWEQ